MRKLVKKYEEFVGDTKQSPSEKPGETTTPVRQPGTPTRPMPTRREEFVPVETPSVNPDPLAYLSTELEGSELKGNTLYYNGHEIEYPSEFKGKEYVSIDGTKVELKKVADYLGYYDVNYDKPELSDVTVGEDGELNNFDAEYEALKGKNNLKESKSYKDTRKFNKRK